MAVSWVMEPPAPPTVDAWRETFEEKGEERVVLWVWCGWCVKWHWHGGTEGPRAAHCAKDGGPYEARGYVVRVVGEWPSEVPHGTEARYVGGGDGGWEKVEGCRCEPCRKARAEGMLARGSRGKRPWPRKGEG